MYRIVFWDVLPCKMIVDNHFTRQYIPEDNSEYHTYKVDDIVIDSQLSKWVCGCYT
jgi:hypothetical protein